MAKHHVLLLGGHGKINQLLTPLLLRRSWAVTSVIRTEEQVPAVQKLAPEGEGVGPLTVLVRSLDDVKTEAHAKAIIDEVKPDYVVWSAGAAGRGGPARTFAIDRDACIAFIKAAAATPYITRFVLVSFLACRRKNTAWWPEESWAAAIKVNTEQYPTYYQAKIESDEALYTASKNRPDFVGINVRPGTLTAEPAGKVELGKTKHSRGPTSRDSVAKVIDGLLASEGVKNCWLDLVDGDEDIDAAVKRVVADVVNCAEGEPVY